MKNTRKIFSAFLTFVLVFASIAVSSALCTAYMLEDEKKAIEFSFEQAYAKPGEPLTVKPEGEGYRYEWSVGGIKTDCTESSYMPNEDDLEKFIEVTVFSEDEALGSVGMFCSVLPVVYIDTENASPIESKDDYIDSTVTIQGNELYNSENSTLYAGKSEIKGHGNSTWKWFPKKAYKLKLDKKTSLFGMGKNKHWLLIANYIDETAVRNALSGALAEIYGAQKLDYVFVDVVFNGESQGLYQLYEQARIDKNRVDIFDWEGAAGDLAEAVAKKNGFSDEDADRLGDYLEENLGWVTAGCFFFDNRFYTVSDYYKMPKSTDGGFLFELDNNYDELSKFKTARDVPIMLKSPEYLCTNPEWLEQTQATIQRLEEAMYSYDKTVSVDGKRVSYYELCDEDSLFSFFLTNEMLESEVGARSTYFYKDIDGKIVFGPIWDFDWSADTVAPFGLNNAERWASLTRCWFGGAASDPYFAVKVRELYFDRLSETLALTAEGGQVDAWQQYLSSALIHNESLWHYSRGWEEDTKVLRQWFDKKISWIDTQLATDASAVRSLGTALSDNVILSGENAVLTNEGYVLSPAADALILVINADESFRLADIFINGRYSSTVSLESGNARTQIPAEKLTVKDGKKNVITVRLSGEGDIHGVQFITVSVLDPEASLCTLTWTDGEKVTSVKAKKNSKILLPKPEGCTDEMLFTGWLNGEERIPAGTQYDTGDGFTLKAVYGECADGSLLHSFTRTGDCLVCEKCEAQKAFKSDLISVCEFDVTQSNRYSNRFKVISSRPVITVSYHGTVLTENIDYTLSFKNDIDPGFATYTITGIEQAGYYGSVSLTYRIITGKISSAAAKLSASAYEYTGKEIVPSFTLTLNGYTLVEGVDYTAAYADNIYPGQGKIILTGIGKFSGTKTLKFNITVSVPDVMNVKTKSVKADGITLTWSKAVSADGYNLYRSEKKSGTYSLYATVYSKTATSFTDTDITPGKTYYYKVKAIRTVNGTLYKSVSATAVSAEVKLDQPAISSVNAVSRNSLKLTWSKVTGATGYTVYRSTSAKGTYKKLTDVTKTTYTDKNCTTGVKYYYKIRAYVTVSGEKAYSDHSAYKAGRTLPDAVKVQSAAAKKKTVTLKWGKSTGAEGYVIYRADSPTGKFKAVKTVSGEKKVSFSETVKKSGTYLYKIRSFVTDNGSKIYSADSAVKSLKIK